MRQADEPDGVRPMTTASADEPHGGRAMNSDHIAQGAAQVDGRVAVIALEGVPEIHPGDDLAAALVEALALDAGGAAAARR